jgi:hypothetical protein
MNSVGQIFERDLSPASSVRWFHPMKMYLLAVTSACLLSACTPGGVAQAPTPPPSSPPPPQALPLYVLPVHHQGMSVDCTWLPNPNDCKPSAQDYAVQDELTRIAVNGLRQRGFDAKRANKASELPKTAHIVVTTNVGQPRLSLDKDKILRSSSDICAIAGHVSRSDPEVQASPVIIIEGKFGIHSCLDRYLTAVAVKAR